MIKKMPLTTRKQNKSTHLRNWNLGNVKNGKKKKNYCDNKMICKIVVNFLFND